MPKIPLTRHERMARSLKDSRVLYTFSHLRRWVAEQLGAV